MAADEDATPKADETEAQKRPRRSRPPVTIDLEARPVEASANAASEVPEAASAEPVVVGDPAAPGASGERKSDEVVKEPPTSRQTPPPPKMESTLRPQGNWVGLFVAGLIGGLIVLLIGLGLEMSGVGPGATAIKTNTEEAGRIAEQVHTLSDRIATLEARPAMRSGDAARLDDLAAKVGALETGAGGIGQRLDKLAGDIAAAGEAPQSLAATSKVIDGIMARLDNIESTSRSDSDAPAILGDRITALETSTAVLSGRLDALADQMQTLTTKPPGTEDSEKVARAVAIGTLRQAAGRGGGFAADLAMIEALDIGAADVAALRPLAQKGAPSAGMLAADFPSVANAILAAAAAPGESGGIVDRLIAHARGLVTIRPVGPIAGDSTAAIVSRMQAAVDKNDLAAALKERDGLGEAEKTASANWAAAAADRVAIDRLVEKLVAALGATTPGSAD